MLDKEVTRFTRGGMQRVNLATGQVEQLTDSGEHRFRAGTPSRSEGQAARFQRFHSAEDGEKICAGTPHRFTAKRKTVFQCKNLAPEKRAQAGSRPTIRAGTSGTSGKGSARKPVLRVKDGKGKLEAARAATVKKRLAARRANQEAREKAKKASGAASSIGSQQHSGFRITADSLAGGIALHIAGNAAGQAARAVQEHKEDQQQTSRFSPAETLASVKSNAKFTRDILQKNAGQKGKKAAKKAARQAAVQRKAAQKAAAAAAKTAAAASRTAAAATAKTAVITAGPIGLIVILILVLVILLVLLISTLTSTMNISENIATLDNPALESYVESLDSAFRAEVEEALGENGELRGSYPDTNAFALAVLVTGNWAVDQPVPDEIKDKIAELHEAMYSFSKKTETHYIKGEGSSMGKAETVTVVTITSRKPESMLAEAGYLTPEEQQKILQQLEALYDLQDALAGFETGGGGITADPDAGWIGTGIFQWPLPEGGTITSYFGNRENPFTGEPDYHTGTDIAMPEGTPIMAAADGTVEIANSTDPWGDSYGYFVKIQHSGGLETLYAHCSRLNVTQGQKVRQGEVIAYVGSTGNSTGNHLHFEVRKDGKRVDALDYFTQA